MLLFNKNRIEIQNNREEVEVTEKDKKSSFILEKTESCFLAVVSFLTAFVENLGKLYCLLKVFSFSDFSNFQQMELFFVVTTDTRKQIIYFPLFSPFSNEFPIKFLGGT